jgi:hypothetical protein
MEVEQRIAIKFLVWEGFEANRILAKLAAHFGEKADALQTLRFWIRKVSRRREDFHGEHRARSPSLDCIGTMIFGFI